METKQFPEKWAVRADEIDLTPISKYINNANSLILNFNQTSSNAWFCYDGVLWYNQSIDGYTEVTLEDLIAHYEPTTHPKWMPLTRGGYEYKIVMEDRGDITYPIIIIVKDGSVWFPATIKKGLFDRDGESSFDLIPYNPRIAELEEKITSKRSELAELEWELKGLKG